MWLPGARHLADRIRTTAGVDGRVADAVIATPRHRFVHWRYLWHAYDDASLPTGPGTTISQPTYVARVISAAQIAPTDRVLEIGTGSGWTAAVMARLGGEVVTVDRVPELVRRARSRLAGASNVHIVLGDGAHVVDGTFDAIIVMAGAPSIPPAYTDRLREGGRLVIPVGERRPQGVKCRVVRVTRRGERLILDDLFSGDWNFLRGADGFDD